MGRGVGGEEEEGGKMGDHKELAKNIYLSYEN